MKNKIKYNKLRYKIINQEIQSLNTLKKGVETNRNTFFMDDPYGNDNILRGYLDQRSIYLLENRLIREKANFSDSQQNGIIKNIASLISRNKISLNSYQKIYNAVQTNGSIDQSDPYYAIFKNYKDSIENADNAEKNSIKNQYLTDLKGQMDNLQHSINDEEIQKNQIQKYNSTAIDINSNNKKIENLQSNKLAEIDEKIVQLNKMGETINLNLDELRIDEKDYIVKAPKSGVIHLITNSIKSLSYVGHPTNLAIIYPVLNKQKKVKITSYVLSEDISDVQIGQELRFRVSRNTTKPIIIKGRIVGISVSPVLYKHGSYYLVTSEAYVSHKKRRSLKYGIIGKVSIITGKKTYFNYYKDKMLNIEN